MSGLRCAAPTRTSTVRLLACHACQIRRGLGDELNRAKRVWMKNALRTGEDSHIHGQWRELKASTLYYTYRIVAIASTAASCTESYRAVRRRIPTIHLAVLPSTVDYPIECSSAPPHQASSVWVWWAGETRWSAPFSVYSSVNGAIKALDASLLPAGRNPKEYEIDQHVDIFRTFMLAQSGAWLEVCQRRYCAF